MNSEQQRIAIAKACGWKPKTYGPDWHQSETKMPDYCNDLNAMHELEKGIENQQWWKFVYHLTDICGGGTALGISATAAQRAEAFLRTLGKWEDGK